MFSKMRSKKGAAAVEFALILPLVTLLLFGIIDFGRLFFVQISLTSASREAVRTSSFFIDGCLPPGHPSLPSGTTPNVSDPCYSGGFNYITDPTILAQVQAAAEGASSNVKAVSQLNSNSNIVTTIIKPCSLIPQILETEVRVSIVFDWILPLGFGSNQPYKLSSKGFMKCLN
jgi:Flp pilus assembly pilin Flp